MQLTTPIIIEDVTYTQALVSLSITATPTAEGGTVLAYVRRIVPARVVEGVLETRQDLATSVLLHGNPATQPQLTAAEAYLQSVI